MDKILYNKIMENASPVKCPNPECNSEHFLQTIKMKRVSALVSSSGKEELFPVMGPLICVDCHRPLTDKDFGYNNESDTTDVQSTG